MNGHAAGQYGPGRIDAIRYPSKTFLITDHGDWIVFSGSNILNNAGVYPTWRDSGAPTVHGGGCNWLFVDQHAEWHQGPFGSGTTTSQIPWGYAADQGW